MKNEFKEFYTSKVEISNPDKTTLIVLDTNVLLNIYRISKSTRKDFLDILEGLKDNLFIPYQIGLEYHLDRQSVLSEFKTVKDDLFGRLGEQTATFINRIENEISQVSIKSTDYTNKRKEVVKIIKEKVDSLLNELKDTELTELFDLFDAETDESDRLSEILNGKVGPSYMQDEIEKIQEEGKKRYANEIPPGYADKKKKTGQLTCYNDLIIQKEYGDLISWFQILDKAKEKEISAVVFVTDDSAKGDWYYEKKGARAELKKEMLVKSNAELVIIGSNSFIKQANSEQNLDLMDFEFADENSNEYFDDDSFEIDMEGSGAYFAKLKNETERISEYHKLKRHLLNLEEDISEVIKSIDYHEKNIGMADKSRIQLQEYSFVSHDIRSQLVKKCNFLENNSNLLTIKDFNGIREEIEVLSTDIGLIKSSLVSLIYL
ncbi:hypothetical protein HCB37_01265 [Listeria booriae]|uniref:PIN-like domain-containing protein n=1 Tax=Listeria booriae TaxID=1552123 RepID=UPI0016236732|nr:PIN-like domain-containing protein [Listeria booriae]MBC2263134.1 hypothetical protein [Listeria booriae]